MKPTQATKHKIQKNGCACLSPDYLARDTAEPLHTKDFPGGWALLAGLLIAGTLLLAFLQPIEPDSSVYLLHTQTWLERGNRFLASHDSKGPLMVWLTAPFVALFHAGGAAAGAARAGAALASGALIWMALRRQTRSALLLAALAVAVPFSPLLWGDSLRPETYAPILYLLAFLLLCRDRLPAAAAAGGLMVAACFLKTLLIIPALALLAGALLGEGIAHRRFPGRHLGAQAAGALGVLILILGVLAWRDSIPQWYRQTLEWPAEFRRQENLSAQPNPDASVRARAMAIYRAADDPRRLDLMPLKIAVTLGRTGLWPLVAAALWPACWRGVWKDRKRLLVLAWLGGELLVLGLEFRRWLYPAAGLLAPLALWFGLSPAARARPLRTMAVFGLCAVLPMWSWSREIWTRLAGRWRGEPQSPYEALAADLRSSYRTDESLLVLDNNYTLHLLLPTPPPPPVLSLHAAMVNPAEREALRRELERHPPVWLTSKDPAYTGIRFGGEQPDVRVSVLPNGELEIRGPYRLVPSRAGAWARRLAPDLPEPSLNPPPHSD